MSDSKQTPEESKKIEPSSLLIQVNSLIMFSLKYTPVTWKRLLPLTLSKVNCSKNTSFLMADLEIRKTFSRMSLTWGDFGWNGGSCKDTDFQLMPINTNTASTFSSMLLWNVAVLGKVWDWFSSDGLWCVICQSLSGLDSSMRKTFKSILILHNPLA